MRVAFFVLLAACGVKKPLDSSNGAHLKLSQPFVGTVGFESAIAVGRPILVALSREGSPEGLAAADMSLQISGGPYREVVLAPGQSLVWLDAEADYRFVALRNGAQVGHEPLVRARPLRTIRAYERAQRITHGPDGCTQREDVRIDAVSLAQNQELLITILGIDATQGVSAGWLSLTPRAVPEELAVESPLIGSSSSPNTFSLRPVKELGATFTFIVSESETRAEVSVTVPTSAEPAPCVAAN